MRRLPPSTHPDIAAEAEQTQAQAARRFDPAALSRIGERLLAHLDPDGSAPSDQSETMRDALGSDSMPLTSDANNTWPPPPYATCLGNAIRDAPFGPPVSR